MEFSTAAKTAAEARFPGGSLDFFCSSDFCIDCSSVQLNDEIAKGSYGTVYAGVSGLDGESVAVKIEEFSCNVEEQVNLLVELTVLQSLPHERMVRFVGAGYVTKTNVGATKIMILMELCKNGALREALKLSLPWNLRVRMALEIAQGLAFLHSQSIIHRDIKTTNVLIDGFWHAKLCDFSFACHDECTSKREFIYGTDEFMSPEIALALDFSLSSDIFSFGIVLCEIMTCREPSEKFLHRRAQDMFAVPEHELRVSIQKGCPEALITLALQCCHVEPANRPTAQMCVDELEVLLNDLGGPEIEFIPIQPVKQQVLSNAFAVVNGVREGHVHCPKTIIGTGGRVEIDDNREKIEKNDVDGRFALLEVQVQELRAENRRLNREMHAMMVLYAERDRLFSTTSPSLSRSSSRHDGSSVSRRGSVQIRPVFSNGSSISRPPLDIRSGVKDQSEGISSKTEGISGNSSCNNSNADRPWIGEIISRSTSSNDPFAKKRMDQEEESSRIKAAILGAAEQIVLEAVQHLGNNHPVNDLIHPHNLSSSTVDTHRASSSSLPDSQHTDLQSQMLDIQLQLDAIKATLNQQCNESNSAQGGGEKDNDGLNDAVDDFDLSHCINSNHEHECIPNQQLDVNGICQDSTDKKPTMYVCDASSNSSSSSYSSESESTRSPRQKNCLNGLEATPVNGIAPSAASDLSTALGKYLSIVKNFSLSALHSTTPDLDAGIVKSSSSGTPTVVVPSVLQIACDQSSDADGSDSISSDSISMSQYGSASMGTILSPGHPMGVTTAVWNMHSLGSPSAISDDDNSPILEGSKESTNELRDCAKSSITYDTVGVLSPILVEGSVSVDPLLVPPASASDDAKENQCAQTNSISSSQMMKKKSTEKKKKTNHSRNVSNSTVLSSRHHQAVDNTPNKK